MSTVNIKANTIKQTTQRRTNMNNNNNNDNNNNKKSLLVRGINARRPLIQGERIAHVSG